MEIKGFKIVVLVNNALYGVVGLKVIIKDSGVTNSISSERRWKL